MTPSQVIAKCNKKAWRELKAIQVSHNMIQVEDCIGRAIEKTFGFWNLAFYKIDMRKAGKIDEADRVIAIRQSNKDQWQWIVRAYLIANIPSRMHTTIMYKKLTGQLPAQLSLV